MGNRTNNEFQLYLDAGRKLTAQGDFKQAEKILGYGLKMLEKRLEEENLMLQSFIGSLVELQDKQHEDGLGQDQSGELSESAAITALVNEATQFDHK